MKTQLFHLIILLWIIGGCNSQNDKQKTAGTSDLKIDRTVLPIQPPKYAHITELDARKATPPPEFKVEAPEGAPNIIVILIDDIGFSASETFGGAIKAPNFDRLAKNGISFNRFHTTSLCSPTRASLLSGRNHHNVNVGTVMEVATGFPGNQGVRPDDAKYVAEVLRQNGYSTAAFGKWHETAPWETSESGPFFRWPTHSGFDKFYGFIAGETNQWDPLIHDGEKKVDKKDDPDYHFTTDMTDETIKWLKFQNAMTPDKPVFIYYATGATHAPHHAPKEWIDQYKGKFDDGWDKLREETLIRQKAMGIVPENTRLTSKPEELKDWDQLSADEKKLFARQMEVYAGYASHTDHEIGRLIDAVEEIGELDNALIIYIMGDNGASAEGGPMGTYNEMIHLNGIFDAETVENMLARADDWGGPDSYPHFSAAWAVATDAPFKWTKQMGSDFGGTRNGMVIQWPKGFKAKGEIRTQWHHVNDIAPTILEAANIPFAKSINGVEQKPYDGVSLLYALDDKDAPDRHTTQYFEMFGNRGIYHEGWLARVIHRVPWGTQPLHSLQEDVWELYNTKEDFSLYNNLADKYPEKVEELKKIFDREAIKNNVYPIDDRTFERFNADFAGRPDLMGGRKSLTLAQGMTGILENAFLNVKNKSKTITANLDLKGNDRGIILCQGGQFGGWAFYMDGGKPAYTYNWLGLENYTVKSATTLPKGRAEVKMEFVYEGGKELGKGGVATIFVNGEKVAEGRIGKTQPLLFSADETADVGVDGATQVVNNTFKNIKDSEFTGYIEKVVIKIPE